MQEIINYFGGAPSPIRLEALALVVLAIHVLVILIKRVATAWEARRVATKAVS